MPADAAETRFPPDKTERALWGLPPMSERERRLAKNGAGPKGCLLSKSRSDPFGARDSPFSALAQETTASEGIV